MLFFKNVSLTVENHNLTLWDISLDVMLDNSMQKKPQKHFLKTC